MAPSAVRLRYGAGMQCFEVARGAYRITTNQAELDRDAVHAYLTRSYWAEGISKQLVDKSMANSLCFGVLTRGAAPESAHRDGSEPGRLVGFARVASDYATFAYLMDVFILEEEQGKGLGKWLLETILSHPELQGLRRWLLATRDAHEFYRRYGFELETKTSYLMQIVRPGLYLVPHDSAVRDGAPPLKPPSA